jgi:hypothetical protein
VKVAGTHPMSDTVEIEDGRILNAFQRWRMCRSKIAYGSSSEANAAAERLGNSIYQCQLCHSWHTSRQKWGRRPAKRTDG